MKLYSFVQASRTHIVVTTLLAAGLVPVFHFVRTPLRFAWHDFLFIYWVQLSAESIALAIGLFVLGQTREFLSALRTVRPRIGFPFSTIFAMLLPAAYFFVVFFLVLSYNSVIAVKFFNGSGDFLLAKVDSFLLAGYSVSRLSHFAVKSLGPKWLDFFQIVYFGLFTQIGACIVLLGVGKGWKESFKFAGALATAYYIALLCFLAVPATGPFYHCADHLAVWGQSSAMAQMQLSGVAQLNNFSEYGQRPSIIGFDYYIALPCMHLVQPLIILWFLRGYGRVFWIVLAYDLVITASVLILEQHYVVDLLMAVPVAIVAVAMVDWKSLAGRSEGPTVPSVKLGNC